MPKNPFAFKALLVCLAGCALPDPGRVGSNHVHIKLEPPGASAVLVDTAESIDRPYSNSGTYGRFFVASEINAPIVPNSIGKTRGGSIGMGRAFNIQGVSREIPAGRVTVKALGTHFAGSPVDVLAYKAAGKFHQIEGILEFDAKAGHRYRIGGLLIKDCSLLWIEDEETQENVQPAIRSNSCPP